ncbi:OmpA family protein [Endozoicomonas euniceicola]|uniref:OmpA family protein n=1 Tax=Endozoicomonas euniceicola TaxID=1234143 RepID=A0ABY6GWP8_9GAMM|nr:OmpA family protein [Endozoicomonas euniceicola]UYM17195.1 OmpA family protein [Endozoicomonas euniceicola]
MTARKLKFSAIILTMLFTAGCASTSNQQHTSAPSRHWAVCAAKGGAVLGVPAAAYSWATGGVAFLTGAVISGTACALADPVADDVFEIPYQDRLDTLYFAFNSTAIRAMGEQKLNGLLTQISDDSRIIITGHACAIGTRTFNQDLSERRAMTIKNWLINRGVPEEHIKTRGRGESEPVRGNETEVMRRENRRAVIRVTQR